MTFFLFSSIFPDNLPKTKILKVLKTLEEEKIFFKRKRERKKSDSPNKRNNLQLTE